MFSVCKRKVVNHPVEKIFNLVRDIENYPSFILDCVSAELLSHQMIGDNQAVDVGCLNFAKGLLNTSFTTKNTMVLNERIDMQLVSGSFKQLSGYWQFTAIGSNQSEVAVNIEFEFSSKLFAMSVGKVLHHSLDSLLDLFCQQADKVTEHE